MLGIFLCVILSIDFELYNFFKIQYHPSKYTSNLVLMNKKKKKRCFFKVRVDLVRR